MLEPAALAGYGQRLASTQIGSFWPGIAGQQLVPAPNVAAHDVQGHVVQPTAGA